MSKSYSLPTLQKEIALLKQGYRFIAGLDEAGRGAWAGPVVAAAVILPLNHPQKVSQTLARLNDSKKLRPTVREELFAVLQQTALAVSVGVASAATVDEINVLASTRQAMGQALADLTHPPDYLLLDHITLPQIDLPYLAFPKADCLSLSVAAASVIAKVTRDQLMVDFNDRYPGYAFDRHKGYGTALHRAALAKLGPCPIHRLSYQPLKMLRNEDLITSAFE
jgi:ribonuclease HII